MYHVKTEKVSVGINTYNNNGTNLFSQTENIRQYNRGSKTHPIQHVEFGVNTNSYNPNFSTQTEPIDLSNQTTNTPYFNETATQLDATLPEQQVHKTLDKQVLKLDL